MTLKELIQQSDNIVFFGGAGVSTESGIPDFRSETGIYNTIKRYNRSPEEILSHSFFVAHPDIFYDFYKSTMLYLDAKPNAAHLALAKLEEMGKLKAVVTQNIDGLTNWPEVSGFMRFTVRCTGTTVCAAMNFMTPNIF